MYLPLHNDNVSTKKYFFKLPVRIICIGVSVYLALIAFFTCVLITMYKDSELANHTHCNVPNIFPSISASIGSYEPQKTIWRTAIYLHAPTRFLAIYLRSQYYLSVIRDDCYIIVKLAVLLNIIENLALLGLTHWSSSNYYSYHEVCFKIFIGTSIFYMLLTCLLLSRCRRRQIIKNNEKKSLKMKWRAFIINVTSFIFAAYFFLRHNRLCEPYVYSMFGLSEYVVVVTNIAFHYTTIYDIKDIYLTNRGLVTE